MTPEQTTRRNISILLAIVFIGFALAFLLTGCATGMRELTYEHKGVKVREVRQFWFRDWIPAIFPSRGKIGEAEFEGLDLPNVEFRK